MADEKPAAPANAPTGSTPAAAASTGAAPAAVKPAGTQAVAQEPKAAPAAAAKPQPADKGDSGAALSLDAVRNIPVTLTVVLGSVSMPVSELMNLQRGKTIELKKKVGDPVDVLANGKLIARGEIVVMEEEEPVFAVSLTELVASGPAVPSAKSQ